MCNTNKYSLCYKHVLEKEQAMDNIYSVYSVAGKYIRFFFKEEEIKDYFDSQMRHMLVTAPVQPFADISVSIDNIDDIMDTMDNETEYLQLPNDGTRIRLRNAININGLFISWNSQRKKGIVTISVNAWKGFMDISHNFTPLFQLMAKDLGVTVVHSACIGIEKKGLLIGGVSGSGKSSLAIACLEKGMLYVSDDTILFDAHSSMAYPVCSMCHISDSMLRFYPKIMENALEIRNGRASKKHIDISAMPNMRRQLKISAIINPIIEIGKASYIEEVQRVKVIKPIVMSTAYQIGEEINSTFSRELFHELLRFRAFEIHVNEQILTNADLLRDYLIQSNFD